MIVAPPRGPPSTEDVAMQVPLDTAFAARIVPVLVVVVGYASA
jgi:hypothetical protein